VCLVRARRRWRALRRAGAAAGASAAADLGAALDAVEKRVHGGRAFGVASVASAASDGGDGDEVSAGGGDSGVREALQRARTRRRVRVLLANMRAARGPPPPPLASVAAIAGDSTVRWRRSRAGGYFPAPWAPAAAAEALAASARAAGAARRGGAGAGAGAGAGGPASPPPPPPSPPRAREARSGVDTARASGRDRVVAVRDEFFGVRRVVLPFSAPPAEVTAVEEARGLRRPGPADYRTEEPRLLTALGSHRRAPGVSIGATTGRESGSARSALGPETAAALAGPGGDELGLVAGGARSAPREGDVLELDAERAAQRPNAPRAPRFSFPRGDGVAAAAAAAAASEAVGGGLEAVAGAWGDAELSAVRSADTRRIRGLGRQVARALRFVRAQEAAQREAAMLVREADEAVEARFRPDAALARAAAERLEVPPAPAPAPVAEIAFDREMLRSVAADLDRLLAAPLPVPPAAAAAAAAAAVAGPAAVAAAVPSRYTAVAAPPPAAASPAKRALPPRPAPPVEAQLAFEKAAAVYRP